MRSLAGSKARTHGEHFESLIERTCRSYSKEGVAEIKKTPEPLRVVQPLGKGQFRAVFTKKAQPDFQGTLTGGRSVVFEAKHTQTTNLPFDRVNPEQARDLNTHHKMGALCFILVSFKFEDFYAIEWLELAVIKWDKDDGDWGFDYSTPITDGVVERIEDLGLVLGEIYRLPEEKEVDFVESCHLAPLKLDADDQE